MTIAAGTTVGPYEILGSLGAGGMGEVYRARDTKLNREVAIKVLPPVFQHDDERLRRFVLEAQAAAALDHPNILAIYQIGTHENAPFIVSELLKGATLRDALHGGPLPVRKASEYGIQIARGLAAAHDKGIVHRDLKPDNVFVTEDGRVKILDFGVAKLMAPDAEHADQTMTVQTGAGTILGTAGYMAPEQLRGQPVDARSDVFSLGAVLYEMLSGRRAFHKDSSADTMSAVLHDDPPELTTTGRPIPPILDRIVRRCLEKQPQERFQSARDVAFALEDLTSASTQQGVPAEPVRQRSRAGVFAIAGAVVVVLLASGVVTARRLWRPATVQPVFKPLTFRRGALLTARFAPDGDTIVYGAAWDGRQPETFAVTPASPESRPLGMPNTDVYAVSTKGELALSVRTREPFPPIGGLLEEAPLLGGAAPRQIQDKVEYADWGPDGSLAVTLDTGLGDRLEYPIGTPLYAADWAIHMIRVSPDGGLVAFMEPGPRGVTVAIVDRAKNRKTLSDGWLAVDGIAWTPAGDEICFSARSKDDGWGIYGVTRTGAVRLILRTPEPFYLQDVARDGRVLVSEEHGEGGIRYMAAGADHEQDLSWLDHSNLRDISPDGKAILFNESGAGGSADGAVYVRKTDGSPAVRLGSGGGYALSPDGQWALTAKRGGLDLTLTPTGAGTPRRLKGDIQVSSAAFLPDGRRIVFVGRDPDHKLRLYLQDLDGDPRAISPPGEISPAVVSPDGRTVAVNIDRKPFLIKVSGGSPQALGWARAGEAPVAWSSDGRSLFMASTTEVATTVDRVDVATGARTPWKTLLPSDAAGVTSVGYPSILDDGRTYAYTYQRRLSQLFVVTGLK